MIRQRVLQVLLVLAGLALIACLYPLVGALTQLSTTDISKGDQMILGIYFPIGIFLLLAVRKPEDHRSLILCFAWSTLAHDAVMVVQAVHARSLRQDAPPLALIALVCVALLALAPRKGRAQQTSVAAA